VSTWLLITGVATVLAMVLVSSFCEDCSAEARAFLRELFRYLR
jgi:hypothetical protein